MGLVFQSMNLDYIRSFVVLGQSQNMTVASRKMGVTPSSMSRHIKGLEDSLGVKLVRLSFKGRKIELTKDGVFFFEKFEKIYNELLLVEKEYKEEHHFDSKITIGVCEELNSLLMEKVILLRKKYPNMCIKIVHGNTEVLSKELSNYSLDLILDKNEPKNYSKYVTIGSQKIEEGHYCIAYNPDYFPEIDDLSRLPFILPVNQTADRILFDEYFASRQLSFHVSYEVDSISQMIQYIKEGLGVGILLKHAVLDDIDLSYQEIDIHSDICVSYVKDILTPSTKDFLRLWDIEL